MKESEYNILSANLTLEYDSKLRNLREEYISKKAEFKVGDFIYNVTGIIKINKIGYDLFRGVPEIIYYGYRYKKVKGKVLRTKDKRISDLRSNVKKLKQSWDVSS